MENIELILYIAIFTMGTFIGSFLNVVIYRVPIKESIVFGRSHCTNCNTQIKNYDLVPIFSYLILKGKCRNCKSVISPRYAIVEFFTGVIFLIAFLINGLNPLSIAIAGFSAILIVITLIDLDTMTIPDSLLVAIAVLIVPFAILQNNITIQERILGFFIISFPMFVLTMIIGGAFGGGDIKFMAVCGALLGAKDISVAMFIAILLGGIYSIYILLTKKVEKGTHIPFGPYLCVGCYIAVLYGTQIIDWYLMQLYS
ncbi:MAG: prepilin peptidase [Clostridia bacterium]